ncbi:hypothetical protein [Kribbella sp. NPDC006257]|uniref:galactose-binding domain-containing protein n=1 Tax=Kribbella sp. NPDC006257 TaxID=3156738 RepID=UPI0033BDE05C
MDIARRRLLQIGGAGLAAGVLGIGADGPAQARAVTGKPALSSRLRAVAPPAEVAANPAFSVQVRPRGAATWTNLFVYKIRLGHQADFGTLSYDSSMAQFDFNGTVDVRVTYAVNEPVTAFDLRPASYGVAAQQQGNTLSFSLTQNLAAPRKLVLRINNDWETKTLHLVTNPIEGTVTTEPKPPSTADANVHVIQPGADIPLQLPQGKDTYYFAPGLHVLPRGQWVEIDMGRSYSIDAFVLTQAALWDGKEYPNKFTIEMKNSPADPYVTVYDGMNNTQNGTLQGAIPARTARYARLRLFGSNATTGWIFSNTISEFALLEAGTGTNRALNRAVAGAVEGFASVVDGDTSATWNTTSGWARSHSGESFFLSRDGYHAYLAPGSVVQGSFMSDGFSNVTVSGRGILDCSQLNHTVSSPAEARTGAVWLIQGSDNHVAGITILDSPMWNVVMNYSTRPRVSNVNIFGAQVNADGVHLNACTDGVAQGLFIRTPDDNCIIYHFGAATNNTFKNSVLWGDGAHIIKIGSSSTPGLIDGVLFENVDILNQQGVWDLNRFTGCLKVWANHDLAIQNITFKDVRIDPFRFPERAAVVEIRTDPRNTGEGIGKLIQNVSLQNITYRGSGELAARITADAGSTINHVAFTGYTRQGALVTKATAGNITIGGSGTVSAVTFA